MHYNHILIKHLGDDKPTNETRKEFETIHNYVMMQIKQCQLEKCNKLHRNCRNREKQQSPLSHINDNNDSMELFNFYVDILDTIHCFLIHTFDIGFRIKSDELSIEQKEEQQIDGNEDLATPTSDDKMGKLRDILSTRRRRFENIRGGVTFEHNKFNTDDKQHQKQSADNSEQKGITYIIEKYCG